MNIIFRKKYYKSISQTKPNLLVWFGFIFKKHKKPNQIKPMKISSVRKFFWQKICQNRTDYTPRWMQMNQVGENLGYDKSQN